MAAILPWVLALGGGAAWGLCFGRGPAIVVPWIALVPLLLLLGHRRAMLLGLAHGIAVWLTSIFWIVDTLEVYGQLSSWLALLLLIGLASYLALYQACFAGLGRRLWLRGGLVAMAGLPALWVVLEWVRGHLLTGFPWNLAAYAWIDLPGALSLAAWIGPHGVSFLVLLANTGLARSVATRRWQPAAASVGLCLVMLAVGGRWAAPKALGEAAGGAAVRVVQPNAEIVMTWEAAQIESNYRQIIALSQQACDEQGALVVWPESAAWPYSYGRHTGFQDDLDRLVSLGCPVLFNSTMHSSGGDFNSVLLVSGGGKATEQYDKRHLVPFGEYVPLAQWLPFVGRLARNAGDFSAGRELSLLGWEENEIGTAICFEVTFPEEVAEQTRRGATLLVTVTNDAWYGDSSAPWQHFRAARFRAAENDRYMVRAALTGISAIVGPDGQVKQMLGVGEEGIVAGRVAGRSRLTPYSRAPRLLVAVCAVLAAFAIFVARRGESR